MAVVLNNNAGCLLFLINCLRYKHVLMSYVCTPDTRKGRIYLAQYNITEPMLTGRHTVRYQYLTNISFCPHRQNHPITLVRTNANNLKPQSHCESQTIDHKINEPQYSLTTVRNQFFTKRLPLLPIHKTFILKDINHSVVILYYSILKCICNNLKHQNCCNVNIDLFYNKLHRPMHNFSHYNFFTGKGKRS